MAADPKVFISYSRADGEEFATRLRRRLEREAPDLGIIWQDRARMQSGAGWWKQITDAIDAARHMVMVMTPTAFDSETVRKEWRYARQQGVCVCPVKGAPEATLDFGRLPLWMKKLHFSDLEKEWEPFLHALRSPCQVTRVPFMATDKPEGFVERPEKSNQLRQQLLDPKQENPVAITTALSGAGGFGKTTLAIALCHDDDIINAFTDGILWVTLGERPRVLEGLTALYAALTGERQGFVNVEDATAELAKKLEDKHCLIVIDDVWKAAHLRPFLRGGKNCARLIATRQMEVASDAGATPVTVDAMTPGQAMKMLTARLGSKRPHDPSFQVLAVRLGEWPLMLDLARSALQQRLSLGDTVEGSVAYLEHALDKRGARAFDRANAEERNQAIGKSIEVSLALLTLEERTRYEALAVAPEDTDIPLTTASRLWSLDRFETEELALHLHNLSLVRFNLQAATLRFHDVMRAYVSGRLPKVERIHARLVDAWGDPYHLPDDYAWRWYTYHLKEAGRYHDLHKLLLDFNWMQAKLEAADITALIADYEVAPASTRQDAMATFANVGAGLLPTQAGRPQELPLQVVQGALCLSAHVLGQDSSQLAGQLTGRLLGEDSSEIQGILGQAAAWKGAGWLRPLTSSLTPPGGPLLRTLAGHSSWVSAVAVTPDGKYAVSGSTDHTLKVWDLGSGREVRALAEHCEPVNAVAVFKPENGDGPQAVSCQASTLKVWDLGSDCEVRTLAGHSRGVNAVAVTPDGKYAVSGSTDHTLKVWDLGSGRELRTLGGHSKGVRAVAVTPDGRQVVSASDDHTLKVWDLGSGREVQTLARHSGEVYGVAVTPDGKQVVSASDDHTLKVWDLGSGREVRTLAAHRGQVYGVAVTPDGERAVSASFDGTLKVWELRSGREVRTLAGHSGGVLAVAVTPDGKQAVSASFDGTLKVWDLWSGREVRTLAGHSREVSAVAVTPDGKQAISASTDHTLKVWELGSGCEVRTLAGHRAAVSGVAVTPDGKQVVSASFDGTLKVWELGSGREVRTLAGHSDRVNAVAVTPDGKQAVSASDDKTLKVWDIGSWRKVRTLEALRAAGRFPLFSPPESRTLAGHRGAVSAVAVTPDGKGAVSASDDRTLKVWALRTGWAVRMLAGHGWVNAVAVTPDGKQAVSASSDRTLRVWDLASGKTTATFTADAEVSACAVADAITIVAGDRSGRLHFLRLIAP